MAQQVSAGPLIALGGLLGGPGGTQPREYSDEIGPSIFWAGSAIPATGAIGSKDKKGSGAIPCVFSAYPIRTVNAGLSLVGALTTAANAVAGTPLPNITTYVGGRAVAPGTPMTLGGVAMTGVALDAGLDNVTFGAAARRHPRSGRQYLALSGRPMGRRVERSCERRDFDVADCRDRSWHAHIEPCCPCEATSAANGPQIALTNRYNPNAYGASGPPSSIASMAPAGSSRILIPELGNGRGVGITGVAGGTGGPVLILGTDLFGTPQSEIIAATAGATTVWSKKTYDIFVSATPQFSDAHNYTVATSDFIGLPISVLSADSIVAMSYGSAATVPANFTIIPADLTNPATQTTGDPRGGIQLSASGPGATPGTPLTLVAGNVLTVDQRLNPLRSGARDLGQSRFAARRRVYLGDWFDCEAKTSREGRASSGGSH